MKMSDKDLDQLFNAQLADLEVEPSAAVWGKIAADMKAESSDKKGTFPYMQIAAGITVLVAAGLWFAPHQEKISLHGTANKEQQTAKVSVKPTVPATDYSTLTAEAPGTSPKRERTVNNPVKVQDGTQQVNTRVNNQPDTIQYASNMPPVNTDRTDPTPAIKNPVTNTLAAIPRVDVPAKQPVPALAGIGSAKKKKIHTLGDILNVVIAKVDKRDNKIIEFSNDDDDDAFTVSGINLGPLKVKKQN